MWKSKDLAIVSSESISFPDRKVLQGNEIELDETYI